MGYLTSYYNLRDKPKTSYPEKLVQYLIHKFDISGKTLLEAGVGRSEHLFLFQKNGLKISGFDSSLEALEFNNELEIFDSENEVWPYPDDFFDVVYSKSFVEHLYQPVKYFEEVIRILKPGGRLITLTPDWEVNSPKFYDDFTHKSPFTVVSLRKIMEYSGFSDIEVAKFRQLPIVWKYPQLNILCDIIAPFVPVRTEQKFLRWSRELMLIGSGIKPQ